MFNLKILNPNTSAKKIILRRIGGRLKYEYTTTRKETSSTTTIAKVNYAARPKNIVATRVGPK